MKLDFYPLKNKIQDYSWGSLHGIEEATGIPNVDGSPKAELWMGSHPVCPSLVIDPKTRKEISLLDLINQDCSYYLGNRSLQDFGCKLPYLFKILSAESPLSLQVHPSLQHASAGFTRENTLGLSLNDPKRNYKDDNHKPEIIVAITPFIAMCGFRNVAQTAAFFTEIDETVFQEPCDIALKSGYSRLCDYLLNLNDDAKKKYITSVQNKISSFNQSPSSSCGYDFKKALEISSLLLKQYPSDIGILAPFYLNIIELVPGEGLFLPSGVMHAYIRGTGLELMASSDNVLRGGLTPKHIDVTELLEILDPSPYKPDILAINTTVGVSIYAAPAIEFELSRISPNGSACELPGNRPIIALCLSESITLTSESASVHIMRKGDSVFIPAGVQTIAVAGSGICFAASLPHKERS